MLLASNYFRVLPLVILWFPLFPERALAGGTLVNGANVSGSIATTAQADAWTFSANKGDDVWVSVSEAGSNTPFVPQIQLLGPDGSNDGYNRGDLSAGIHIAARLSGTYTAVVSRWDNAASVGDYSLTLAKSPGSFVVPPGDEGGSMTNGQNYAGKILRGDLDQWNFVANKGDDLWVSVSESGPNTAFVPQINLIAPDGIDVGYNRGDLSAGIHITATLSGTYTAVVSRWDGADGTGSYLLTLARSTAAFVVAPGDEGGPITDGQNKLGAILRGDLDQWSFKANEGDDVWVSVSEVGTNTPFVPQIILIGPNGRALGYNRGDLGTSIHTKAPSGGAYTVIVSRWDNSDGSGRYELTLEKSPSSFVVPDGDQGGPMTNGENYSGSILRDELEQWSFSANKGDDVWVSVSESGPDTAFVPQINLIDPNGRSVGYNRGDLSAGIHIQAAVSGPYTAVVSRWDSSDGAGKYLLTLSKSPASFVIPSGDDGGPMISGQTYSGTVLRGDLDQWTFYADQNSTIRIGVSETGTNTAFVPQIYLIGPDGNQYGYNRGDVSAVIQATARLTGAYKVVVSRWDSADGAGTYSLSLLAVPTPNPAFHYLGVSASPDERGTITASPASVSGYYPSGTRVCLAASPEIGFVFSGWSGAPLDASGCLTMNANKSVMANFVGIKALRFVPIPPCRLADTRYTIGPFGGPSLAAGITRDFVAPDASVCNLPYNAEAYSLNATVLPKGRLNQLTLWPTGQQKPTVSTLSSLDGRIKAAAAIIPAGTDGGISVFTTDTTDVILDVNGYFVPSATPSSLAFYPVKPCRIADTRSGSGEFGEPSLMAGQPRTFPVLSGSCGLPSSAKAYSLNFTAVPKSKLGYLTVWPTGQQQPNVSTLNAPTGTVVANAAIVAAGSKGAIDVFASNETDLIIDVNGYFAPPASGALSLYNLTPCRILDTRQPQGSQPFSGNKTVNASAASCSVPASSQELVLNATVIPPGPFDYLTLWRAGQPRPTVSTLSALDAAVTSNLAIVPDSKGLIDAFASNPTHLILDISGYFAP